MKKYLLPAILLLLAIGIKTSAAMPIKAFIQMKTFDDKGGLRAAAVMQALDMNLSARLKNDYPCIEYLGTDGLAALIFTERQRQLLGTGDENYLQELSSALGCKYLINLDVKIMKDQALISAVFMDNAKAKTLSRSFETAPYGDLAIDAAEKAIKNLFDGLKIFEICPFKGEVNINIISTKKDKQLEEYPVYCNGTDGTYSKTTTTDNFSENDWKIQKEEINASSGSVTFNLSEEFTIEEYSPCYECSSKKQGNRSYTEKTTTYADVSGLSNESESYGIKVDDARSYLTFLDDGTYTLRIKAASTHGQKKTIKDEAAQGVCDNINKKPETTTNKIDEGINEILGPFVGNAQDKILSQKETITRNNPTTGEEETFTYEFTLSRD